MIIINLVNESLLIKPGLEVTVGMNGLEEKEIKNMGRGRGKEM